MYDIALYGHLVLDSIRDGSSTTHDIGGIINVWRSLKLIDSNLNIYVCPTNIGSSDVYIDRKNSFREGKSHLNQLSVNIKMERAKINLISYINFIQDIDFIYKLDGIVCADICSGKNFKTNNRLDYLFASEEDANLIDYSGYSNKTIIHSPKKSYVKNTDIIFNSEEYLKDINPLGAGDFYAAYYIYSLLNNKSDIECIQDSHIKTTNFLKDKNDTANKKHVGLV